MRITKPLSIGLIGASLFLFIYAIAYTVGIQDHILAVLGLNLLLGTAMMNLFFGEKFPRVGSMITTVMGVTLVWMQMVVGWMLVGITYLSQSSVTCVTWFASNANNTNYYLPANTSCWLPQQEIIFTSVAIMVGFTLALIVITWIWFMFYDIDEDWAWRIGFIGLLFAITFDIVESRALIHLPSLPAIVIALTPNVVLALIGVVCGIAGILAALDYQAHKNEENARA